MATFVKLTRAVGTAKGQCRWVNFDHVTDFSRGTTSDVTVVYFSPTDMAGSDKNRPEATPFGLYVRETPEQIMEALAKHG